MSGDDQITRLQGLLERVRKNAALPRAAAAFAPEPPTALVAEPEREPTPAPAPVIPTPPPVPEPVAIAVPVPEQPHELITGVREIEAAAPEVSVEEEPVELLDLDEEEIVDITDLPPEEAAEIAAAAAEIEEEEALEEAPASSRRAIAATVGEALAGVAEEHVELDEGREIPLKTPPPESGPQVAPPPMAAPAVPHLDIHAEAEIVSGPQPTAAQLGSTVELEEAPPVELEVSPPPPLQFREERAPTPPPPAPHLPTPPPPARTPPPPAPVEPERIARPAVAAAPAHAMVHTARAFVPASFLELLEASISLGKD